jgi:hypothetical protein
LQNAATEESQLRPSDFAAFSQTSARGASLGDLAAPAADTTALIPISTASEPDAVRASLVPAASGDETLGSFDACLRSKVLDDPMQIKKYFDRHGEQATLHLFDGVDDDAYRDWLLAFWEPMAEKLERMDTIFVVLKDVMDERLRIAPTGPLGELRAKPWYQGTMEIAKVRVDKRRESKVRHAKDLEKAWGAGWEDVLDPGNPPCVFVVYLR